VHRFGSSIVRRVIDDLIAGPPRALFDIDPLMYVVTPIIACLAAAAAAAAASMTPVSESAPP